MTREKAVELQRRIIEEFPECRAWIGNDHQPGSGWYADSFVVVVGELDQSEDQSPVFAPSGRY